MPGRPSQTVSKKQQQILNELDIESKFAMLLQIREERSHESVADAPVLQPKSMIITTQGNPYEPAKLISPDSTSNRQSQPESKMLTLKNLKPS